MATIANVLVDAAAIYVDTSVALDGSSFALQGYTSEGSEFSYGPDVALITVHEETVPINAKLAAEDGKFNLIFAESDLTTMNFALTGGSFTSDVITLGGGVVQFFRIKLVTDDPENSSKFRKIEFYKTCQTGNVTPAFKKDDKTMLAVEFTAIKNANGWVDITRNMTNATD